MPRCSRATRGNRAALGSDGLRTPLSLLLAAHVAVYAIPAPASAAPPPPATPTAGSTAASLAPSADPSVQPTPDPLDDAQDLYQQGRVAFETANYEAAIERWTDAYSKVPHTDGAARIKALLIYDIATARERVFAVSKDASQLRQAKILLEDFARAIPGLYADEEVRSETQRVQARIAAIQATLDQAEPTAGSTGPDADAGPTDAAGVRGRGLVVGGAVGLSLGVAGLAMMGAGLGVGAGANDISDLDDDDLTGRGERFDRGRTGNTLAVVGGILGGVGVVAGVVMLALGVRKRRRVTWTTGPAMVGLGLAVRL